MIYLASPYSHPSKHVMAARYDAARRAVAKLMRKGKLVFSPIVHSHPLVEFDLPNTWEFWQRQDKWYLKRAKKLVVLKLMGWDCSVGVTAEVRMAEKRGIKIRYMEPE